MKKEMLINVLQPEECRIAIVEDGVLEELYVERASQESYVGNIYKGKIVNIEQGIQAAFVDFGIGRNGFLHVTDVDPVYYKHLLPKELLDELNDAERDDRGRAGGSGRPPRGDRPRLDRPPLDRPPLDRPPLDRPPLDRPRLDREPQPAFADDDDAPPPLTSFLPTAPMPSGVTVETAFSEDISEELQEAGGFLDGLDDDAPTPPPIRRMPIQVTNVEAPRVKTQPTPPPKPTPAPPAADDEDDGFGEGLDFDDTPRSKPTADAPRDLFTPPPLPTDTDELEDDEPASDEEGEESAETASDEAPKKRRPKTGTGTGAKKSSGAKKSPGTKGKADDPKAKPKKPKKKDDDAKPRPMDSAERRTSEKDEPEIRPFFDDDAGGFDVDAPNDRFARQPGPAADQEADDENGFAPGFETDDEDAPEGDAPAAAGGFSDADMAELDAATERRFRETDEERDQRRGGGRGRGDRDRGPRRDGPPRGGDRGPRGGGDRGGPRGGPPGPFRGGPLQNKAHTRHKGLPIPPIQDIFKRGQEVIVQVIKEGIGTKGPTLSTFVSIAGRYLVLMPSLNRVGVSKKIEDRDARHRLRDIMNGLNPPKGVGFIVRTAAVDRDETELRNDLTYLLRLWQVVVRRIKRPGPVEVYRESDMITRTIRDIFTADIDTIWVDEEKSFAHASEFLQIVMPKYAGRIRYHGDTEPLFHKYRVDEEIAKINHKRLELPGGGSLIIEQTEALVAIDVNSGNFRAEGNAEETAFQMNLRAAKEIARQLRLRDLGGVIVNDFIDMRAEHHRRTVEDTLRNALRRDRARTKILRISEFGIIEMTRQRMQPSLKKRVFNECPHCVGTGYVKTNETMGIEVMRLLQLAAHRAPGGSSMTVTVHSDVAFFLLNRKRREVAELETKASMDVTIDGKFGVSPDLCEFKCFDTNGMEVRLVINPPLRAGRFGPPPRNGGRRED